MTSTTSPGGTYTVGTNTYNKVLNPSTGKYTIPTVLGSKTFTPTSYKNGTSSPQTVADSKMAANDFLDKQTKFNDLQSQIQNQNQNKLQQQQLQIEQAKVAQQEQLKASQEQQKLDLAKQNADNKAKVLSSINNQNQYSYQDNQGQMQTVQASSGEEALKNAKNIAPHSGVILNTNGAPTGTSNTQGNPQTNPQTNPQINTSEPPANTEQTGYESALDTVDKALYDSYASIQKQIQSVMNGTFPLNPTQQALINSTQQLFDQTRQAQQTANQGYTGGVTTAGFRKGGEYTPEQYAGQIHAAVSAGVQKIANLDAQAASEIAKLKLGFDEQNYAMINDSYKKTTDYLGQKEKAIQDLHKEALAHEKEVREGIQKSQDKIDDLALKAAEGGAFPDVIAKIRNAKDYGEAVTAAVGTLDKPTGIVAEYQFYVKDATARGHTPVDFNSYQTMDANRKVSIARAGASGGFTPAQINSTINSIAGAFDNEPIVKNYNIIAEGKDFIDSIPNDTKNPADQQGFIYAFAKIMDPNSVVREGEYNTVQKYAQSWADTYGFNAKRIFTNSPFLSSEALKNMKATISSRYDASKKNYDNVYNEYQKQLNSAKSGNARTITNYSAAHTTGNELLQNEDQAKSTVSNYISTNPGKSSEIASRIQSLETAAGRPITTVEFLEAYPEYK